MKFFPREILCFDHCKLHPCPLQCVKYKSTVAADAMKEGSVAVGSANAPLLLGSASHPALGLANPC